jgi:hypothetical protein
MDEGDCLKADSSATAKPSGCGANGEAQKLNCPNCERVIGAFALRCRVCHQRLFLWYVIVVIFAIAALTGLLFLLELI